MTPEQLIETILKPLGTELRHYMPKFREEAIEAAARAIKEINKEPLEALSAVTGWAINSQLLGTEESNGYFDESDVYKKALAVIGKAKSGNTLASKINVLRYDPEIHFGNIKSNRANHEL